MQQIKISYHHDGKVALIEFNQPESFNSFTRQMLTEIRESLKEINENPNIRAIGITGVGKAFCAGQNLKEALDAMQAGQERPIQKMIQEAYNPLVLQMNKMSKPVVTLVNGPAVGAGAIFALIADFSLASESSYFAQAFVNIGLIPDTGGTYYLPRLLGRQMAHYLAFTGEKISANEAKSLGLIAKVYPDEQLYEKGLELLGKLAQLPTQAIALTKQAIAESYNNTLEQQLELEAKLQYNASETKDFKEGIAAFLEKRKPHYEGK